VEVTCLARQSCVFIFDVSGKGLGFALKVPELHVLSFADLSRAAECACYEADFV
jgi:hypothetical protein